MADVPVSRPLQFDHSGPRAARGDSGGSTASYPNPFAGVFDHSGACGVPGAQGASYMTGGSLGGHHGFAGLPRGVPAPSMPYGSSPYGPSTARIIGASPIEHRPPYAPMGPPQSYFGGQTDDGTGYYAPQGYPVKMEPQYAPFYPQSYSYSMPMYGGFPPGFPVHYDMSHGMHGSAPAGHHGYPAYSAPQVSAPPPAPIAEPFPRGAVKRDFDGAASVAHLPSHPAHYATPGASRQEGKPSGAPEPHEDEGSVTAGMHRYYVDPCEYTTSDYMVPTADDICVRCLQAQKHTSNSLRRVTAVLAERVQGNIPFLMAIESTQDLRDRLIDAGHSDDTVARWLRAIHQKPGKYASRLPHVVLGAWIHKKCQDCVSLLLRTLPDSKPKPTPPTLTSKRLRRSTYDQPDVETTFNLEYSDPATATGTRTVSVKLKPLQADAPPATSAV